MSALRIAILAHSPRFGWNVARNIGPPPAPVDRRAFNVRHGRNNRRKITEGPFDLGTALVRALRLRRRYGDKGTVAIETGMMRVRRVAGETA